MKGYVYILTNEHMPGLVKIGRTTTDPESRAAQLYQTGVPGPFAVFHSVVSPDCVELERHMHEALAEWRLSGGREFFRVPAAEAMQSLKEIHEEQVTVFLDELIPNAVPVDAEMVVEAGHIAWLAHESGLSYPSIRDAMNEIRFEELRPALERVLARYERARAARRAEERS